MNFSLAYDLATINELHWWRGTESVRCLQVTRHPNYGAGCSTQWLWKYLSDTQFLGPPQIECLNFETQSRKKYECYTIGLQGRQQHFMEKPGHGCCDLTASCMMTYITPHSTHLRLSWNHQLDHLARYHRLPTGAYFRFAKILNKTLRYWIQ